LAKAQQAIQNAKPYALELENTVKTISGLVQDYEHDFFKERKENKKSVILVISSDKGLCGGYNSNISKEVVKFVKRSDEEMKVFYIGKKAREIVKKQVESGKKYEFTKNEPTYNEVKVICDELADLFKTGEVGKVYIAYNVFASAISFQPTIKQVLPMTLDEEEKTKLADEFSFDFLYEPEAKDILDTIIPSAYVSTVYTCLLDALASEHGSRMSSMDSATNNCKDAIRTLTLKMNKLRQAAITTELIEVVSGAESLNG
jgi:F-type H+-transporting ATPase subunit gamma